MATSGPNEFGFKRLTVANWLAVDPAWRGVLMSSSLPNPSDAWVNYITRIELDPTVPLTIRRLFEMARGSLAYSLMYYPLLTLGAEQIFRVLETAASAKCEALSAPPKVKTFEKKIDWLLTHGALTIEQQARWHAIRHLRNEASHPQDQSIILPGMALSALEVAVELINLLFT